MPHVSPDVLASCHVNKNTSTHDARSPRPGAPAAARRARCRPVTKSCVYGPSPTESAPDAT
eukprot:4986522-Prymnesium_polylepis.1